MDQKQVKNNADKKEWRFGVILTTFSIFMVDRLKVKTFTNLKQTVKIE